MAIPSVSKKCRYALRALFELALRNSNEPVKIQDIASAQAIPPRFLEVILAELKHGGFVESRRGNEGGYILARPANSLAIGEVIGFLYGSFKTAKQPVYQENPLVGDYVFHRLWKNVSDSVLDIYNNTTFAEMVEQELAHREKYVSNYAI